MGRIGVAKTREAQTSARLTQPENGLETCTMLPTLEIAAHLASSRPAMNRTTRYTLYFAGLLTLLFLSGNPHVGPGGGRSISAFPSGLSGLVVVLVLWHFFKTSVRSGWTARQTKRRAWRVVLGGSALFALCAACFSLGLRWHAHLGFDLTLAAAGATFAFLTPLVFSWLSILGWGRYYRRRPAAQVA
jgi:hypothetical protein